MDFMFQNALQCHIFPELQLMALRKLKTFESIYKIYNFTSFVCPRKSNANDLESVCHEHTGYKDTRGKGEMALRNGTSELGNVLYVFYSCGKIGFVRFCMCVRGVYVRVRL